jgi:ribosome maturation factor RimP
MATNQARTKLDDLGALLAPTLHDMGFDLVQVTFGGGQRPTLQVMAEPVDRAALMTVDDCAAISHAVSVLLDVADPIEGAYALEVSSPGIDRPLVRLDDFRRFAGHEVRVELDPPHEGRKRLKGRLDGVAAESMAADAAEDGDVLLTVDGAAWRVPYRRIRKAKLVLTDALIAAAMKGSGAALEVRD